MKVVIAKRLRDVVRTNDCERVLATVKYSRLPWYANIPNQDQIHGFSTQCPRCMDGAFKWKMHMRTCCLYPKEMSTQTPSSPYTMVTAFTSENVHSRLVAEDAFREKRYEEALKRAFLGTDEDIFADPACDKNSSGCTAVAALVTNNNKIYVVRA